MTDVVVVGGGFLGSALARHAGREGAQVLVASRTQRAHAGLWRAFDADTPKGLLVRGARVFVAIPGDVAKLVTYCWREGAASVTVCGDVERARIAGASRTALVRVGLLFGQDDRCVWPLVKAVREHGVTRIPRGLPTMAPVWVEDAVRAVWRMDGGDHRLRAATTADGAAICEAVTGRFGGRWAYKLWGRAKDVAPAAEQATWPDVWDPAWGTRTPVTTWVERLPGLRRKR